MLMIEGSGPRSTMLRRECRPPPVGRSNLGHGARRQAIIQHLIDALHVLRGQPVKQVGA